MDIKRSKNAKVLALGMIMILGSFPAISQASFFDWLGGSGQNPSDYSNLPIFQSSFVYANSSFSSTNKDADTSSPASGFQDNAVVSPSGILAIADEVSPVKVISKIMTVRLTAYSSTPDQTDASPFITAKGTMVHDGIVAANFLPFNTLIKIPTIYGDKIFVVEDRMHARFTNYVDIWFPDRSSALQFGSKTAKIEIVGTL